MNVLKSAIGYRSVRFSSYVLVLFFFFFLPSAAFGQDRFSAFFDFQDDFLHFRGHGTDRYYSGGLSLGLSCDIPGSQRKIHVFSINQRIFTPSDIAQTALIPGDYPYQGLLYFSFTQHRFIRDSRIFGWTASAGTTGPYAWAGEFQSEFHRWIGYKKPLGWDNVVSLGHYLQGAVSVRQSVFSNSRFFIGARGTAEIGTVFNRMGIAAEIKLGSDILPFLEHSFFQIPWKSTKNFQLQVFVIPSVDFVVHNRLLEEGLLHDATDPNGLKAIQVKSWVGSLSTGIQACFGRFSVLAVQHANTREFSAAKSHQFGQVMFLYRWQ